MPATGSRREAVPEASPEVRLVAPPEAMTVVTLVHTQGCHFCADARAVLAELCQRFRFRVRLVEADTADGGRLVAAHRPSMYPLVLVDGAFFSQGRLPRRKLEALLSRRAAPVVAR